MITFYPNWNTPVGSIANVSENQSVTFQFSASRLAQFTGETSNIIDLTGIDVTPSNISNVFVNTQSKSFNLAGNTVIIHNTIVKSSDVVKIVTTDPLSYTLLHDNLPSGLSMSNVGLISGSVNPLPNFSSSQTYTFAVRVSDGFYVRDREFSITANVSNTVLNPPEWGSNLPSRQVSGTSVPFFYIPLGSTFRSTLFNFQLDIFEPNNLPPTLSIEKFIDSADIVSPFNDLPLGLSIDAHSGLISGVVDPSVLFGDYYFKVAMADVHGNPVLVGTGATPIVCKITIEPSTSALQPLRVIVWNTPAGTLASMYEGQVFPVSVNAVCTTGEATTYSLVNNTYLPPGLKLDPDSGNIEGVISHVAANTTYNFTVRANVQNTFSDRNFSITVLVKYNTYSFINMNFKIRTNDSLAMSNYYSTVIGANDYFRPTDDNFGILGYNAFNIYVVGGLFGTVQELEPVVRASNIKGPITLRLGDHKIAYATLNGSVIYEVLYRDIVDPMSNAGGYTTVGGVPVKIDLPYPELVTSPYNSTLSPYLYPNSINNIRDEFILKLGFPSLDTSKQYVPGLNGSENLPFWMSCPQSNNDPSTAIGFIPAVVIGYLKPGTGQSVLNRIAVRSQPNESVTAISDPIRTGHEMDFDQYFVIFDSVSDSTTFDSGNTTFDKTTTFDVFAFSGSKFFRINKT